MADTPIWFNEQDYLKSKLSHLANNGYDEYTTPDQAKEAITAAGLTPFQHFQQYSLEEKTSPSQHFNTYEYLQAKAARLSADPELEEPWTADTVADTFREAGFDTAWDHYQAHGTQEGINPSNSFDANAYLAAKLESLRQNDPEGDWELADVKQAFAEADLNPVSHFLHHGEQEGLTVSPVPEEARVEPDPLNAGEGGDNGGGEGNGGFNVVNDGGEVSFVDGSGNISFVLEGTVATFSRGEQTDTQNTVDFAAGPVTLNLGEDQTLSADPASLQGVTVDGGGKGSYQAALEQPLSFPEHAPTLRNLDSVNLHSTVAAAGLIMTHATDIQRIVNEGSTEALSVLDLGEGVDLAAKGVNPNQNPQEENAWNDASNFIVRYRDADAAPESQRISLEDSNLNVLTVTAQQQDDQGNTTATSAEISSLVIESNGSGPNSVRGFDEGEVGLGATVEAVRIEGEQALTIADLPHGAQIIDAGEASGDQHLVFNGGNAVLINGGSGNDTLVGSVGNDAINGGEGNDILFGRGGADTFAGGDGNDTFVIQSDGVSQEAADIVLDFNNGADQLNFQHGGDAAWFSRAEGAAESFEAALQAANEALVTGEGDVRVNAQQVGDDLWVFGDTDGNGQADALVQLTGVALDEFTEAHVHGA